MKDKIIFRKNMLKLTIICLIAGVLEEAFFAFFMPRFIDEDKRWVLIVIMCALLTALIGLFGLLFSKYLVVNDETVTFCKLFKRKQTLNWKDTTITEKTTFDAKNGTLNWVIITDGNNEIKFSSVSAQDLTLLKELCKTAREKYNTDNITF